jgi:inositol phosphorylceramide mannosyltransferase catalytic subunit
MQKRLPARIIQTGKTRDLPLSGRAAAVNLKCLNPDFEHLFFDDQEVAEFVKREFPEYWSIFEMFPFRIQKYDFFRYLAVFRMGGFYFDTDVFFASGLHELLPHACVFPFEELSISQHLRRTCGMDWEIGNYGFGAVAGHPFLAEIIANCVRAQREPDWVKPMMKGIPRLLQAEFLVLNTTGPGLITRTLAENPKLAEDVTVIFPEDVCEERSWHQFGDFGYHAMEGSWRLNGNFLFRRLANIWESWARRHALAESRTFGSVRSVGRPLNFIRKSAF